MLERFFCEPWQGCNLTLKGTKFETSRTSMKYHVFFFGGRSEARAASGTIRLEKAILLSPTFCHHLQPVSFILFISIYLYFFSFFKTPDIKHTYKHRYLIFHKKAPFYLDRKVLFVKYWSHSPADISYLEGFVLLNSSFPGLFGFHFPELTWH